MKISEAMRIGAAKRPQAFGSFFDTTMPVFGSCALGAVYEGFFGKPVRPSMYVLPAHADENLSDVVSHPINKEKFPLQTIIKNLNDVYRWTREQIADWLERLGY